MTYDRFLILTMILGAAMIAPSSAVADAPDGALRVFVARFEPTADFSGPIDIGGGFLDATVEAESTTGVAIGWEIGISPRIGLQSELMIVTFDFEISAAGLTTDFGSATAIPFVMALQWHVGKGERVDVYVGPLVAYTLWGNLESEAGVVSVDSTLDFGLRAGIDVPISERWALAGRLDYITASAGDASATVDIDPTVLGLGIAYRY